MLEGDHDMAIWIDVVFRMFSLEVIDDQLHETY